MEDLNSTTDETHIGVCENLDMHKILLAGEKMTLQQRVSWFNEFINDLRRNQNTFYSRVVISPAGREVEIIDPFTGKPKKMLMFGSNNYLGLANHPYVCQKVKEAVSKYGIGIGGPPLLNGYIALIKELEERLSVFKGAEDTLIFSSGFSANLGLASALFGKGDLVLYDELSHASFFDGLKLGRTCRSSFHHNDIVDLKEKLIQNSKKNGRETFVCVEGVYSMDGDLAPLDKIIPLCKTNNATLIIDDAHGTGVTGKEGKGTTEHFGMQSSNEIVMGTFSKAFAVNGGFVSASKPLINYLRYFARTYMFSASLPPMTIAAVLAGLDVIENEPERRERLHENVKYAATRLQSYNLIGHPAAGILCLKIPPGMNIRKASVHFHKGGIFLNSVEYPAVPLAAQRFRISLMCEHTKEDIDKLVACVEETWEKYLEK